MEKTGFSPNYFSVNSLKIQSKMQISSHSYDSSNHYNALLSRFQTECKQNLLSFQKIGLLTTGTKNSTST